MRCGLGGVLSICLVYLQFDSGVEILTQYLEASLHCGEYGAEHLVVSAYTTIPSTAVSKWVQMSRTSAARHVTVMPIMMKQEMSLTGWPWPCNFTQPYMPGTLVNPFPRRPQIKDASLAETLPSTPFRLRESVRQLE